MVGLEQLINSIVRSQKRDSNPERERKKKKEVGKKGNEKAPEQNKVVQSGDKSNSQESTIRGRGIQCNSCHKFGHIARNCTNRRNGFRSIR